MSNHTILQSVLWAAVICAAVYLASLDSQTETPDACTEIMK